MSSFTLDERVQLSIALALTTGSPDQSLHQRQDAHATRLGMTGAEIDAARRGRSFDVRISLAQAVALASRGGDAILRQSERARARRGGISESVCREIEAFAGRFAS